MFMKDVPSGHTHDVMNFIFIGENELERFIIEVMKARNVFRFHVSTEMFDGEQYCVYRVEVHTLKVGEYLNLRK